MKHVTAKIRFLQERVQHKIIRRTLESCVLPHAYKQTTSFIEILIEAGFLLRRNGTRKNVTDMMTKQSNGPQFNASRVRFDVVASAAFAGLAVRCRR